MLERNPVEMIKVSHGFTGKFVLLFDFSLVLARHIGILYGDKFQITKESIGITVLIRLKFPEAESFGLGVKMVELSEYPLSQE